MKRCFKCNKEKPLIAFYKHPMMGDGHFGKCIDCTKRDVNDRAVEKSKDPEWVKSERERHRRKQSRYRKLGLAKLVSKEARARWVAKNIHKIEAQRKAAYAVRSGALKRKSKCESCGKGRRKIQMHHHDYSKPLDVKFLCTACHGIAHRKILTP